MVRVGFLTIGQSPRPDIMKDLPKDLEKSIEVMEAGALDDLSVEGVQKLRPSTTETLYVSRLRDGSQVSLSRERITPLLEDKIRHLEEAGVESIVMLCSGVFNLQSKAQLILPEKIISGYLQALAPQMLGVLSPEEEQVQYARKKWSPYAKRITVTNHSPYIDSEENLYSRCDLLKSCSIVLMDCMGYTEAQRKIVKSKTGLPVLSSRSITFSFLQSVYR